MSVKPELVCAAKWWGDQLRGTPNQDNGDPMCSAFAMWAQDSIPRPPEEQIAAFERALVDIQEENISGPRSWSTEPIWYPDEPIRASALRVLSVDYGPCTMLREACDKSGVNHRGGLMFPMKTVMWVNPGSVKVACGYRAEAVEIFAKESACAK